MAIRFGTKRTSFSERRWVSRFLARLNVGFRERGRTSGTSILYDLSSHGCKVKLRGYLVVGQLVWIKLPTLESWSGRVAWTDDVFAGIQFDRPLHAAVSTMIVQRAKITTRLLASG